MWKTLQPLVLGQDISAEIYAMHNGMDGFFFQQDGSQSPRQWALGPLTLARSLNN